MNDYKIKAKLGEGGMGTVYLAECEGRPIVLKTLKNASEKKIDDFKQESRISDFYQHKNIVKSYGMDIISESLIYEFERLSEEDKEKLTFSKDFRPKTLEDIPEIETEEFNEDTVLRDGEVYCMLMEYIDGSDLRGLQEKHFKENLAIPIPITSFIIYEMLDALSYIYEGLVSKGGTRGFLVHRDISPENILVDSSGKSKLTDFGIATPTGYQRFFEGKLYYASPEQIEAMEAREKGLTGAEINHLTDIYCLGLCFYEALVGFNPLIDKRRDFSNIKDLGLRIHLESVKISERMKKIPEAKKIRMDIPSDLNDIVMRMIRYFIIHDEISSEDDDYYFKEDKSADIISDLYRYNSPTEAKKDLEEYIFDNYKGISNESVKAYLQLFKREFEDPQDEELEKLSFLNESQLKRKLISLKESDNCYSQNGLTYISKVQKNEAVYKALTNFIKENK